MIILGHIKADLNAWLSDTPILPESYRLSHRQVFFSPLSQYCLLKASQAMFTADVIYRTHYLVTRDVSTSSRLKLDNPDSF